MPPSDIEALHVAGDRRILPDDTTRDAIDRAGRAQVSGTYKLCVGVGVVGAVTRVTQLTSTGFPAYDTRIQASMLRWRYRPFLVDGAPTAVCSAIRFV